MEYTFVYCKFEPNQKDIIKMITIAIFIYFIINAFLAGGSYNEHSSWGDTKEAIFSALMMIVIGLPSLIIYYICNLVVYLYETFQIKFECPSWNFAKNKNCSLMIPTCDSRSKRPFSLVIACSERDGFCNSWLSSSLLARSNGTPRFYT